MTSPTICPHDSLRRSCPICERDEEIAELRQKCATLEHERDEARAETDALRIQVRAVTLSALTVEGQCIEEHLWNGQEACGALFDAGRREEELRDALLRRRSVHDNCATYSGRFSIGPFVFSEDDDD